MFFRKIGKVLLGKASGFQILTASICGAMLGFLPGIFLLGARQGLADAPALVLTILAIVLVLNTNLAVFGLAFLLAKIAAIAMLPVSFAIGRFLLDGPTRPLFAWFVNAPFFAWFGLERYATTGGLALGLVCGILLGLLVLAGLKSLQRRMAGVEGNESYQKWSNKFWVRSLSWLVIGVKPKEGQWTKLMEEQRRGLPVRIWGIVAVVVIGAGIWVLQAFLTGPTLRTLAQSGLESWNGATVDLAKAGVDLGGGRVSIDGLALADPNDLVRDSFRARSLDVAVDTDDLLRRRFVIKDITSKEAWSNAIRDEPGVLIGKEVEEPVEPPATEGGKTIEDYVKEAKVWKERLQTASRLLQKFVGTSAEDATPGKEPSAEDLAERARLLGLAQVTAEHLVRGSPRVWVRNLVFDGLRFYGFDDEVFDVRGANLSSAPALVDEPLRLDITSRSGALAFSFEADPSKSRSAATKFVWKGLSIDTLRDKLVELPLSGGTLDLVFDGKLDFSKPGATWVDLPLSITLHGTTLQLPGMEASKLDELSVPLGLRGPLGAPRIRVETKAFVDALVASGKAELANRVRSHVEALVPKDLKGLGEGAADLLQGKKTPAQLAEEAKNRAIEEAKKRGEEELKKLVPGLPGGLFGGKKDDPKKDG